MDGDRFDGLTRSLAAASSRRRVLGGLLPVLSGGVLVALATPVAARKKHKRGHKRKRHEGNTATGCPTGRVACNGACRLPDLAPCTVNADCCSHRCRPAPVQSPPSLVCWPCNGKVCESDDDCCPGLTCEPMPGVPRCGGCRTAGESCGIFEPCCYSACNTDTTGSFCLSLPGERCTFGGDCKSCWDDSSACADACVAGTCVCPDECCADADCSPVEVCRNGKCEPGSNG